MANVRPIPHKQMPMAQTTVAFFMRLIRLTLACNASTFCLLIVNVWRAPLRKCTSCPMRTSLNSPERKAWPKWSMLPRNSARHAPNSPLVCGLSAQAHSLLVPMRCNMEAAAFVVALYLTLSLFAAESTSSNSVFLLGNTPPATPPPRHATPVGLTPEPTSVASQARRTRRRRCLRWQPTSPQNRCSRAARLRCCCAASPTPT